MNDDAVRAARFEATVEAIRSLPPCSCCGASSEQRGCVIGPHCDCDLLAVRCNDCRKCASHCACADSNAKAARAEQDAAHEAMKQWLKEPGAKTATQWGHFLRGWYAHKEWTDGNY